MFVSKEEIFAEIFGKRVMLSLSLIFLMFLTQIKRKIVVELHKYKYSEGIYNTLGQ